MEASHVSEGAVARQRQFSVQPLEVCNMLLDKAETWHAAGGVADVFGEVLDEVCCACDLVAKAALGAAAALGSWGDRADSAAGRWGNFRR
jgi:hypothetical protein